MRITSRRAAVAAALFASATLSVGCSSSHDYPASPVNAVLTDREAVRLAELHLNDIDPQANPRDVVAMEPTCTGYVVSFNTYFDETHVPPKQSRVVMVENDGDVREVRFSD
jgi:hypothetical protein